MSLYSVILTVPRVYAYKHIYMCMCMYIYLSLPIYMYSIVNTEESWSVAAHFYGLWCNYYDKWHYTLNWITARAQKHTSHRTQSFRSSECTMLLQNLRYQPFRWRVNRFPSEIFIYFSIDPSVNWTKTPEKLLFNHILVELPTWRSCPLTTWALHFGVLVSLYFLLCDTLLRRFLFSFFFLFCV